MQDRSERKCANSRRSFLVGASSVLVAAALTKATLAENLGAESLRAPVSSSTPHFTELHIPRDGYNLYAQEYEGSGPAFVLLHGFPDNRHIYDQLIPLLVGAGRRVVAFDFLGFGDSDKPMSYKYSFEQQTGDIRAVVDFLKLDAIVLVAHDAGAVAAIDYVLGNSHRIRGLCLLNSFYGDCSTLKFPELIAFFADPELKALSHAMLTDPKQMAFLLTFQEQQFQADASQELKNRMNNILQPIINQNFAQHPSAGPAFAQMTGRLYPQLKINDGRLAELPKLGLITSIIWGQGDPYLNTGVARDFAARLKNSSLHLIDAGHWPQIDRPEQVAMYLLADISK